MKSGPAGLEPDLDKNRKVSGEGQDQLSSGQDKSQVHVDDSDAKASNANERTDLGQGQLLTGQIKNTTEAQWEHNMSRMGLLSDLDFAKVCKAWKKLPESIKQGIIAMVDSFSKH